MRQPTSTSKATMNVNASVAVDNEIDRRGFLSTAAGVAVAASLAKVGMAEERSAGGANKICAFVKFLPQLSFDEMADAIAELGFDGIEAPVRDRGYILPEHAADKLPALAEALARRGLEVTVLTSSISRADEPHTESVLRTAAACGIKRYRLNSHRYDARRPVMEQLAELKPIYADLVAMSREIGVQPLYQNHSGAANMGAAVWDAHELMRDHKPDDFGFAFDIRHATVEGGLCWPVHFNLASQRLGAVYVKDFVWQGAKDVNVPLGTGRVNPKFFAMLRDMNYAGPISLHVEYDEGHDRAKHLGFLKTDLATLKKLLTA